ncbi:unnamed protein product [Prunus armeniaca]
MVGGVVKRSKASATTQSTMGLGHHDGASQSHPPRGTMAATRGVKRDRLAQHDMSPTYLNEARHDTSTNISGPCSARHESLSQVGIKK